MHILLTDQLICPRCGPGHGLIVMADQLVDRKVLRGRLGCANCRSSYPIEGGTADLVVGDDALQFTEVVADDQRGMRTAALLGVRTANSTVLIVEQSGELAQEVAGIVPEVHVVAGVAQEGRVAAAGPGIVSTVHFGGRIALRENALSGVALVGVSAAEMLREAARVTVPGGRIVVEPADAELSQNVRKMGGEVLLEEGGVMVASAW